MGGLRKTYWLIDEAENGWPEGDEGIVEIAFGHEAATGFVDWCYGVRGRKGEVIRSNANDGTVLLVTLKDFSVEIVW
jgi:hypothetical protein